MSVETPNGRLSAPARVERDRRIAEAREVEGLTWPEVAERFGMDESATRRAYRWHVAGVEAGDVPVVDVEGAVHRVVRVHLAALSRAEALIEEVGESNAGVGLLRVASSVGLGLLDALARTGYLPDPRDEFVRRRVQYELRDLAEAFLVAASDQQVPRAVIDRILAETRERSEERAAALAGSA